MYAPSLIDGAYSNPPAPTTYTAVSALSLPPHRTLSTSASSSLHTATLSGSSPSFYTPSLYSFPVGGYLPSTSAPSSSSSYAGLPSSSPSGLSLFSSPHSSPHSSHLSGRSTPPSVSNLQAVLDAAELSEQRDSQVSEEPSTITNSARTKRTKRTEAENGSHKRTRRRGNQAAASALSAPTPHSLNTNPSLSVPSSPPSSPVSLTEPVDRQSLISAFAVPPSAFLSASWHRQWLRQRKQLFRSYIGAPLTESDATLVALLRRAARLFTALGGGRAASGEKVEQYRVERDLLLALFASELPVPLVSSLFDVSSNSVKRLLEQTGGGDDVEQYINQARQKRLAHCSTSSQLASTRPRNLICKRTGRPMRDENAFAQSFFQRPQLAQADISTVWQEYVRETTATAGGGSDGAEVRRPPLSRAHFFTLAPEERRRKKKEQPDCTLTCQHCGSVKYAKSEERTEQPLEERKESGKATKAHGQAKMAIDPPPAKRAKLQPHSGGQQHNQMAAAERRKAGRPKRALQKSSLTSEMRALLPILLAEQTAPSTFPAAASHEHCIELGSACS